MGGKLSKADLHQALDGRLRGTTDVSILTTSDEDAAYDVLADAFQEDPMVTWVAGLEGDDPEREAKTSALAKSMMAFCNHKLINGNRGVALGATDASGELVGCMTLSPSSCASERMIDMIAVGIRYGAPPVYDPKRREGYGPHARTRMDKLAVLPKRRGELMKGTERWVYLQTIGVRSNHHGKGHGKKMLQVLIKTADELQAAIYLETESAENESLYRHFGFRTLETMDINVPGDDTPTANLKMYLMRKDPLG